MRQPLVCLPARYCTARSWRRSCAAEVEVFTKALEKARDEKLVLKALANDMSTLEAFRKFGII